jgi:hypothetical protein
MMLYWSGPELSELGWDELTQDKRNELFDRYLTGLPDRGCGFVDFVRSVLAKEAEAAA